MVNTAEQLRIVVVGQSHVEAVASALCPDENVVVINLNARDRSMSVINKIKDGSYLPEPSSKLLIASMIGGNFYNTFGLIESSMPFEFAEPGGGDFMPSRRRFLVTYELIYRYFSDAMQRGFLQSLLALKSYYGRSLIHIISPPPIGEDEHILNNPGGYFSDKIHLGVAPGSLRGKLYRLHTRVIAEFCEQEGIPIITPPVQAVTEDGFLAPAFWKKDPTHANAAYGRLVLDQLAAYRL